MFSFLCNSMNKPKENRYMKNRHSAKRVARDMFVGATLHSFDPGWSFNYPSY